MKILAMERDVPGAPAQDFRPLLKPEAAAVWQLYQGGVIRETYFRADRHAAVLVLECASAEAARQALDGLPLVRAGLIDFEIIPLIPYPGFERLFEG
jgi:hypothetical protein